MTRKDIPLIELHRRRVLQGLGLAGAGAGAGAVISAQGVGAEDEEAERETDVDLEGSYGNGEYTLPDLPYAYGALEPTIDARIMELHHSAHHQGYVDGTNDALERLRAMRESDDFEGIKRAKRDLSFNLSGHVNHSIFWQNMSPDGGDPEGEFCRRLIGEFGSVERFREEFSEAAKAVESNGWAWLFYEPVGDQLIVGQVESQNRLAHQDATPLLGLDVWEHAYYLQYENRREQYVDAWWDVVNWDDVAARFEAAKAYW